MHTRPNVLLVEDTPSLSALYQEYLGDMGLYLRHAHTGALAIDYLDREEFDLVLLDLNLPDMDGISILRHMQEQKHIVPTIVITVNNSIDKAVEAMLCGAQDYIVKPFTRERLTTTVRNMLLMRRLEKDLARLSQAIKSA